MTMEDFLILSAYWTRFPPVHVMVRAYLGIGKENKKNDLGELLAIAGLDPNKSGRISKTMH